MWFSARFPGLVSALLLCAGIAPCQQLVPHARTLSQVVQIRKLSVEQLDAIAGSREQLATYIREAYRLSSEQAEMQLASWQQAQKERHFLR